MLKSQEINDPLSCLNRAEDDEPVFVLRAKDPLATIAVSFWVGQAEGLGLHTDRIQEAWEWVDKAEVWKENYAVKQQAADSFVKNNGGNDLGDANANG